MLLQHRQCGLGFRAARSSAGEAQCLPCSACSFPSAPPKQSHANLLALEGACQLGGGFGAVKRVLTKFRTINYPPLKWQWTGCNIKVLRDEVGELRR